MVLMKVFSDVLYETSLGGWCLTTVVTRECEYMTFAFSRSRAAPPMYAARSSNELDAKRCHERAIAFMLRSLAAVDWLCATRGRYARDRKGRRVTLAQLQTLLADEEYRTVARDVATPSLEVVTFWIGYDTTEYEREPPRVFRTMVVDRDDVLASSLDVDIETEAEALATHRELLRRTRAGGTA